jgi:hypothetical protein
MGDKNESQQTISQEEFSEEFADFINKYLLID